VVCALPVGGRGVVREPEAGRLFAEVREDRPVGGTVAPPQKSTRAS